MFVLKILVQSEIGQNDLFDIISVKSVAWPYTYEMQLKWINENLNASDLHLLLQEDSKTVAYLNLINIEIEINDINFKSFGIGNVCSAEKGKAYGNELMILTNQYIKENQKTAILFCKPELVCFYEKYDWLTIEKDKLKLAFDNRNIVTMGFNIDCNLQLFKYSGNTF